MLRFLKRRNKCRKEKKTFLWPIFIKLLDQVLRRPLIYALSFVASERPHKVKFLEDSSFVFNLRDLQKLA